jgi:hypothetical protein
VCDVVSAQCIPGFKPDAGPDTMVTVADMGADETRDIADAVLVNVPAVTKAKGGCQYKVNRGPAGIGLWPLLMIMAAYLMRRWHRRE